MRTDAERGRGVRDWPQVYIPMEPEEKAFWQQDAAAYGLSLSEHLRRVLALVGKPYALALRRFADDRPEAKVAA